MYACTIFFLQERLNRMNYVWNKIKVRKKYELNRIYNRKHYQNF